MGKSALGIPQNIALSMDIIAHLGLCILDITHDLNMSTEKNIAEKKQTSPVCAEL